MRLIYDLGFAIGDCPSGSKKEFIAKLGIVEEEADESIYWLELIMEGGLMARAKVETLHQEGEAILKIVVASRKTARRQSQ